MNVIYIYTQFGLSSKYSCNKNCTIPYFIILISNRAIFAVRGPSSLKKRRTLVLITKYQVFRIYFQATFKEMSWKSYRPLKSSNWKFYPYSYFINIYNLFPFFKHVMFIKGNRTFLKSILISVVLNPKPVSIYRFSIFF